MEGGLPFFTQDWLPEDKKAFEEAVHRGVLGEPLVVSLRNTTDESVVPMFRIGDFVSVRGREELDIWATIRAFVDIYLPPGDAVEARYRWLPHHPHFGGLYDHVGRQGEQILL